MVAWMRIAPLPAALDLPVLQPGLYLAGALLVAALIIALARRWSRETTEGTDAGDQLTHYRSLYEKGEISEEEFKRVRGILSGELRRSLDLPAPSAPSATPASEPQPRPEPPGPTDGIRPA